MCVCLGGRFYVLVGTYRLRQLVFTAAFLSMQRSGRKHGPRLITMTKLHSLAFYPPTRSLSGCTLVSNNNEVTVTSSLMQTMRIGKLLKQDAVEKRGNSLYESVTQSAVTMSENNEFNLAKLDHK